MIVKDQHGNVVQSDERVVAGTTLSVLCKDGYTLANIFDNATMTECLETGQWKGNLNACINEDIQDRLLSLSYHGVEDKIERFPWHVGVYERKESGLFEQMCGGSIISAQVVVSATHCFWNGTGESNKLYPLERYRIMAGKTYRAIDAEEDKGAQERSISHIYYHPT